MSIMSKRLYLATTLLLGVTLTGCAATTTSTSSPDQTSPTAVVDTFYAAMEKGDKTAALAVVPDDVEATADFQDAWNEVSQWTYNDVTVGNYADGAVDVTFDITVDGDQDTGTDQVGVKQIDGKWWVTELPQ